MRKRNDFARKASLFTMNGLVDPRMLAGYEKKTATKSSHVQFNLANSLKRMVESIVGRMKNEPA